MAKRTPLLGEGIKVRPLNPDQAEPLTPAMIELSAERREKLQAFVRDSGRMPEAAKARVLDQLAKAKVPAALVEPSRTARGRLTCASFPPVPAAS